jgi:hypothetical protein
MRNVNFAGMIDIFCLYVPEEGTLGNQGQDAGCILQSAGSMRIYNNGSELSQVLVYGTTSR